MRRGKHLLRLNVVALGQDDAVLLFRVFELLIHDQNVGLMGALLGEGLA